MIRRLAPLGVLGIVALALGAGCGPTLHKVQCKVTLDGKTVEGATVTFVSSKDPSNTAFGVTDSSGVCTLNTGKKTGVAPGDYVVTVTKQKQLDVPLTGDPTKDMFKAAQVAGNAPVAGGAKPGPGGPVTPGPKSKPENLLPDKYDNVKDSGLTCKVPEDTGSVKEFALTSK